MKREKVSLGNLFRVGSSKRVLKSQWKSEGVPFYRGREITRLAADGFVENEWFISDEHFAELETKYGVPNAGDIVVTAIGTIGNSHVVRENDKFYFKDASVLWLKKITQVSSEFINLWLKSSQFLEQLDRGNGATVDTLTIQKLQSVELDLPTLSEQHRIVSILDEAFEGIATATSNAEKNLSNARELFDSTLQAVFSVKSDEWGTKTFSDICEITSALVDPRQTKYLDMLHVGGANIESKTGRTTDLKSARNEGLISGKFVFDESMVLYSKIRPYLMKVARPQFQGLCSADIYPLSCKAGQLDRDFLFYLLLTPSFTDYANAGSARAGMPKVNREHLFAFRCLLPSIETQKRCAEKLDAVFSEVQRLKSVYQQKLSALAELKKSILHQAFTGQLH